MPKPTPESLQRVEDLKSFVQDELVRYEAGELREISPNSVVVNRFGYSHPSTIYRYLRGSGLIEARKQILHPDFNPQSLMSHEGAWVIGAVSAGGYVQLKRGRVVLGSKHPEVLDSFRSTGERLFNQSANQGTSNIERDGTTFTRDYVEFDDVKVARALGDLRNDKWAETVRTQHNWLMGTERYTWSFIEGFFEMRGNVYSYDDRSVRMILLNHNSLSGVNFLSELLVRAGVKNPNVRSSQGTKEKVAGVSITNIPDSQVFAHNVHSKVAEKESLLDELRHRVSMSGRAKTYTDGQLIEEWNRLTILLGHQPKVPEIRNLLVKGETNISYGAYANRFGEGSFVAARASLEELTLSN